MKTSKKWGPDSITILLFLLRWWTYLQGILELLNGFDIIYYCNIVFRQKINLKKNFKIQFIYMKNLVPFIQCSTVQTDLVQLK